MRRRYIPGALPANLLLLLQRSVAEREQLLHDVLSLADGAGGDLVGEVQEDEHQGHDEGELVAHHPLQRELVHQELNGRAAVGGGEGGRGGKREEVEGEGRGKREGGRGRGLKGQGERDGGIW